MHKRQEPLFQFLSLKTATINQKSTGKRNIVGLSKYQSLEVKRQLSTQHHKSPGLLVLLNLT
jgi:hypothetical protein